MKTPLLEVKGATKYYGGGLFKKNKEIVALQDLNLEILQDEAKIVTIAGESGSGKSTLGNLVLGFTPLSEGEILFRGNNIQQMDKIQKKGYRREVQAVFQDPYAVYNPFYTVKHIFDLVMRNFKLCKNDSKGEALIEDALSVVGMKSSEVLHKYPHQLSGGQRQRMMMARIYLLRPSLVVADEPVSMVDASIRSMILEIIMKLRDLLGISFLYITHDLSTAYQVGDDIILLYQGSVAEQGKTREIISNPKHPYVKQLIESIPVPDPDQTWTNEISIPDDEKMRERICCGCRFSPRCNNKMEKCLNQAPPLFEMEKPEHKVACFLYEKAAVKQ